MSAPISNDKIPTPGQRTSVRSETERAQPQADTNTPDTGTRVTPDSTTDLQRASDRLAQETHAGSDNIRTNAQARERLARLKELVHANPQQAMAAFAALNGSAAQAALASAH